MNAGNIQVSRQSQWMAANQCEVKDQLVKRKLVGRGAERSSHAGGPACDFRAALGAAASGQRKAYRDRRRGRVLGVAVTEGGGS